MAKKIVSSEVSKPKIFVLDTSVILYDYTALVQFKDNDIVIPVVVLEELDSFKKGSDTLNYAAREFIRSLNKMMGNHVIGEDWIPISGRGKGSFRIETEYKNPKRAEAIFGELTNDNKILNTALSVYFQHPDRKVILVTKDINMRLKAKTLNILSEDYETGKIKNVETLDKGHILKENQTAESIANLYNTGIADRKVFLKEKPVANRYMILKNHKSSILARYDGVDDKIHRVDKLSCYGIKPRNAEQAFALDALMNPEIKLVSIQGVAGTGKTLLAIAAALEQKKLYRQIYIARPIVPLSNKDLGFLPGDIKSKMNPYMEPLYDNLKFIQSQYTEGGKEAQKINDLLENEKIVVTPLAYIRGRSLSNIFFIVDEAQNLNPHEVKTIITRAGEGTKIIFTGDIFQIDTPYLDAQSNGLSYLIDKVKNQPLYAHITLEKGERSQLANLANMLL